MTEFAHQQTIQSNKLQQEVQSHMRQNAHLLIMLAQLKQQLKARHNIPQHPKTHIRSRASSTSSNASDDAGQLGQHPNSNKMAQHTLPPVPNYNPHQQTQKPEKSHTRQILTTHHNTQHISQHTNTQHTDTQHTPHLQEITTQDLNRAFHNIENINDTHSLPTFTPTLHTATTQLPINTHQHTTNTTTSATTKIATVPGDAAKLTALNAASVNASATSAVNSAYTPPQNLPNTPQHITTNPSTHIAHMIPTQVIIEPQPPGLPLNHQTNPTTFPPN